MRILTASVIALASCGRHGFDATDATPSPPPPCDDPALQAGSPWPVQGGCPTHLGRSALAGPHALNPKWIVQLDAAADSCSSPVVASNGVVFVGLENDTAGVIAVDPAGTVSWRAPVGNMSGSAAIGSTALYAGAQDKLVALDFNGHVTWTYPTTGSLAQVDSSPAVAMDGTIYIVAEDHSIYAVHADGTLRWSFATGGSSDASPAIAGDGTVVVGSSDARLYALRPDGSLAWSQPIGGGASAALIAPDGTIYVGSGDTQLYAFAATGDSLWTFTGATGALSAPAIGADGTIYVGSADDALYAVSAAGALRWKFVSGGPITGIPMLGLDDTIYVSSEDGYLYALAPDGNVLDRFFIGLTCVGFPRAAALGVDGTLFVTGLPSGGAVLFAFPR